MKRFYSLLTVACLVVALCATGHAHVTTRQFLAAVEDTSVYLQWDKSCLLVISVNKAETTWYSADGITGSNDKVEIVGVLAADSIATGTDTIVDFSGPNLSVAAGVLGVTIPAQGDSAYWDSIAAQVSADSTKWRVPEAAALTNLTTSNPLYKVSAGVVACSTATATLRGVAKFSTDNFAVSSGDVTIKSGGTNSDEILDGTVTEVDLNVTNAPGAGEDGYSLTYNHAGTNMTWEEVLGGGGLWDTTANKDTVSLSGTADTTLKITRDGTNDTTKITAPAGTLVLGSEGLTKADSFGVANMVFSRDSISGVDVLNADTIVTDGDVIKDFTGPKLSAVAGVLTVTETDPVYIAGVAFNITASDTVGWNKGKDSGLVAWNWGSHASQGYLTSESDPVWTSDSVDYAMKSWVEALIEDSLNEYSLTTTIAATYEVLLNNEAGLYAVLSNVSNFVQDAEVPGLETDGVWTSDSGDYAMKTWVAAEIGDSTEAYIHNRQWFNLKDYGGVGDSATNDSLSFHSALLGADSTGGIVFVPPGRFSVGTHTVGEGVWLLGIGVKSELLINGQLTVRGDTRISNLWVQPQLSSDSNAVVRFEPSAGTQYRCYADHIYGKWLQIVMSSTVGFEITDCQFRGSFDGSGGIAIYNESQGLIQGNIVDSAKNGIYINHSTQIQILDNVCRHGTQSGIAVAISGGYSQPDTGWNITIQDNHCYGNAHDGIDLNGDANWEYTDTLNMLVDHNFLHHNTHTGIYCAAGFVTISDNLIYQNVTQGIKVARSTGAANAYIAYGVVVSDNHLRNNNTGNGGSDHQILLENVGFAQVTDNHVYWTSGFTTGMEYGIWVQGIAANITGNYVWEHEGSARAANDPLIYAVITNTYTDLHDSMLVYGNRDHHESDTLYCNAPQHLTRSIVIDGTVDGVDVSELASDYATDSTKLDGIEAGADVTDAANVNPVETDQVWVSDSGHFVSEEDTNAFALTILLSADTAMGDSLDKFYDSAWIVPLTMVGGEQDGKSGDSLRLYGPGWEYSEGIDDVFQWRNENYSSAQDSLKDTIIFIAVMDQPAWYGDTCKYLVIEYKSETGTQAEIRHAYLDIAGSNIWNDTAVLLDAVTRTVDSSAVNTVGFTRGKQVVLRLQNHLTPGKELTGYAMYLLVK